MRSDPPRSSILLDLKVIGSIKYMSKMSYITSDHITYLDQPLNGEVDTDRLWFIKRMNPLNDYEWAVARSLSIFWYYQTRLGCSYSTSIERKLMNDT